MIKLHIKCFRTARGMKLFFLAAVMASLPAFSQSLTNTIVQTSPNKLAVRFRSVTNAYFGLSHSSDLKAFQVEQLSLGTNGTGEFRFSAQTNAKAFYRVVQYSLPLNLDAAGALDQDGDGIDDYYEMTHGLNPLNASDGAANLTAYRGNLPLFAWFPTSGSTVRVVDGSASVPFLLSKPVAGIVHYQISGTGLSGIDFQPLSGSIQVNGTSGAIPVALLQTLGVEPLRSLVISLQEPTNSGPYALASSTAYRLDVVDGDRGVYAGTLGFTNDVFIGPQPVKVSVRSGIGNAGTAYFDTSGSKLFSQSFAMDIAFTGVSNQFQFTSPKSGTINSTNLGRNLTWTLSISNPQFTNNTVSAAFDFSVQGLVATGDALPARGTLVLGAVSN